PHAALAARGSPWLRTGGSAVHVAPPQPIHPGAERAVSGSPTSNRGQPVHLPSTPTTTPAASGSPIPSIPSTSSLGRPALPPRPNLPPPGALGSPLSFPPLRAQGARCPPPPTCLAGRPGLTYPLPPSSSPGR